MEHSNKGYTEYISSKVNSQNFSAMDFESICKPALNKEGIPELTIFIKDLPSIKNIGLFVRRYICQTYGYDPTGKKYVEDKDNIKEYIEIKFDGNEYKVKDYMGKYDVATDDVSTYKKIVDAINGKFNSKRPIKANVKYIVSRKSSIKREKAILLSFMLNLDTDWTRKLLTEVLCEQSYSMRIPEEIIAYFCQSHPEKNNYYDYCRLNKVYEIQKEKIQKQSKLHSEGFTHMIGKNIEGIHTEKELMNMLLENINEFDSFSQTPYREFMKLLDQVDKLTCIENRFCLKEVDESDTEKNSDKLSSQYNVRELADKLNLGIPKIKANHINLCNHDGGRKERTTALPDDVIYKPLYHERLGKIIDKEESVIRKDLIYLKFFCFSMETIYDENKYQNISPERYREIFLKECNALLEKCNMGCLSVYDKFDILIMYALNSISPSEYFDEIMDMSFYKK